jgi:hypothetical protein
MRMALLAGHDVPRPAANQVIKVCKPFGEPSP